MSLTLRKPAKADPPGGLVPYRPVGVRIVPERLDLRLWRPLWQVLLVVTVLSAVLAVLVTGAVTRPFYRGTVSVLGFKMENPVASLGIQIVDRRLQSLGSIARSEPFLVEVIRRSGETDLSLPELAGMINAFRPDLNAELQISVTGHDQAQVTRLSEQLLPSLDEMVRLMRAGAIPAFDTEQREITSGQAPDYRGPLYLPLFDGRPSYAMLQRSNVGTVLGGIGLGVFLTVGVAMAAHRRRRVGADASLVEAAGLVELATVCRPTRRRFSRHFAPHIVRLDDVCVPPGSPIGLAGVHQDRLRAQVTLAAAAVVASFDPRPVVLVDLCVERPALSRRCGAARAWFGLRGACAGVLEAVNGHVTPTQFLRPVPIRSIPRQARALARAHEAGLWILPAGVHQGDDSPIEDPEALVDLIDLLARDARVVVHLPPVPGVVPVQGVLERCGVVGVLTLDGWTEFDAALDAVEVLAASSAPLRLLTIENP